MTNPSHQPRYSRWAILSLLVALHQILFAIRVLNLHGDIAQHISLLIPFEIGMSLLWAMLFVYCALILVKRRANALRYTLWILGSFAIYSLLRLIIFVQTDYDRQRIPFLVIIVAALIGLYVFIDIRSRRRQTH